MSKNRRNKKKLQQKSSVIKKEQIKEISIEEEPIFKYLKPNENDKLSLLSGLDLQDLIILLDDYYLNLRKTLGFDESVTFGLEIEFENAMLQRIKDQLRNAFNGSWRVSTDGSLYKGGEISTPILHDKEETWKDVKKVCRIVNASARIGERSGGHIHIGAHVLGNKPESWINFIKLWSVYENIIYRFSYGDFLTARSSLMQYAPPLSKSLWDISKKTSIDKKLSEIIYDITAGKYNGVNFRQVSSDCQNFSVDNTIEFRCPNGTLEPVVWQNNVNFFVNLLNYCKDIKFDNDKLERRYSINTAKLYKIDMYNEVYLDQALELCDIIFNNNLDKVYFLRQYLKSFEIGTNKLEKAKQFVKK